jgi:chromosome segregation ATPase
METNEAIDFLQQIINRNVAAEKLQAVLTSVLNSKKDLEDLKAKKNSLIVEINGLNAEINLLEKSKKGIAGEIEGTRTTLLANVQEEINKLGAVLPDLRAEKVNLETANAAISQKINDLNAEFKKKKAEGDSTIVSLAAQIDQLSSKYEDLKSQIKKLV